MTQISLRAQCLHGFKSFNWDKIHMEKGEIKPRMTLRNLVTGQIGVLYEGYDYGVIDSSVEVPIVYKSKDETSTAHAFLGTRFEELEPYSLKPEDVLTILYIKDVCKPNTEKACRYLTLGRDGFECAKVLGNNLALELDERVEKGSIRAIENNCSGRYGTSK